MSDRPMTLSTEEVARLVGASRGACWAAARDEGGLVIGDQIIRPIKVGRRLRWPTQPLLHALGVDGDGGEPA